MIHTYEVGEKVVGEDKEKVSTDLRYTSLREVLNQAYQRAATGKGNQRHGEHKPFERQDICEELRTFGLAPAVYQIRKKAKELLRLTPEQRVLEALDIIVYAAAIVIVEGELNETRTPEISSEMRRMYSE